MKLSVPARAAATPDDAKPSAHTRDQYDDELVERLAQLLVSAWRRQHAGSGSEPEGGSPGPRRPAV